MPTFIYKKPNLWCEIIILGIIGMALLFFASLSYAGDITITGGLTSADIDTYSELNTIVADVTLTHNGLIDTSSKLSTILTDETGTGLAVFATAPSFTTSITVPLILTGNVPLTIGDATTDSITFTTDGTGNAELVFPADGIGDADIDWGTGAGQVSTADITEETNLYFTTARVTSLIDTFAELDAIVADKALVNKADGAVWLSAHDFGGATSLEIPNGNPTVDTTGEIGVDTTDDQLLYMGATVLRTIPYTYEKCFSLETPAVADDNWIVFLPNDAITITSMYCMVNGGTSAEMQISDGTSACESIVCDADGQADDGTIANGAFIANERMEFDTIAVTGTVPEVTYCIRYTIDRQ